MTDHLDPIAWLPEYLCFACKHSSFGSFNDKNSFSWMENIGEMALYIKGKGSTTYALLELGYDLRACEECQGQGGTSLQRWNLLGVVSF